MDYLTGEQVGEWARHQPVDGYYCEYCLSKLNQNDEGTWGCPNEMCLWDEEISIGGEENG